MSNKDERAEALEFLRWAEMKADSDERSALARRLINALTALDEGRSDPLLTPAKISNSSKPRYDQEIEALAVASIDALLNIGLSLPDAVAKVRALTGSTVTVDLRKKISSRKNEKYKGHRPLYAKARQRLTLGLAGSSLPAVTEKTILDNLALNVLLIKGRLPE